MLHELFPKITSFYTLKSITYILRNIAPFVAAGIVLAPISSFIFNYSSVTNAFQSGNIPEIIAWLFMLLVSAGAGAVQDGAMGRQMVSPRHHS